MDLSQETYKLYTSPRFMSLKIM